MNASLLPALHDALIVAQTSSVGEAARRLHKTPSAVSQQLRRIEEHYGVKLFEKDGRKVRPSPAGEAALGAMTRVFAEAASILESGWAVPSEDRQKILALLLDLVPVDPIGELVAELNRISANADRIARSAEIKDTK